MEQFETWQIALAGFVLASVGGLINFILQKFIGDKSKLENEKLDFIIKSQSKTNGVLQKLVTSNAVKDEKFRVVNNRIDDIESDQKRQGERINKIEIKIAN